MSRGPDTWPRVMPGPPDGSGSASPPPGPAPPTWSLRSPTPSWTRFRWSPSPARFRRRSVGNDAFQEAYTTGITMPATKHNYFVTDPNDIADTIHEAFHIASTGRPGPVLVDLPKDILNQTLTWKDPKALNMPGYKPTVDGHPRRIKEAVELIAHAKRPVLYVGGGVIKANGSNELRRLAELTGAPVSTTLMGRGAFPDSHPLAMGMPGMHGTYTSITAIQKADLLISIGVRFDDRVTGNPKFFAPHAKVIHVDVDPAEIGKVRAADVPIVGDARRVMEQMIEAWGERDVPDRTAWLDTIRRWQQEYPLRYDQDADGPIKPQFVVEELYRLTGGDATVVAGVGQHQMWTSQFWKFDRPRRWINSGGLGTMGFAVPAAIGAKAGMPDDLIFAIDGDGCFQMTFNELITAAVEKIPVKIAVFNNGVHGMVTQWQRLFYGGRFSGTILGDVIDYPEAGRGDGLCRFAGRDPRRGRPDPGEGSGHRRPPGGGRDGGRSRGDGLPDGPRRRLQRRSDPGPVGTSDLPSTGPAMRRRLAASTPDVRR